MIVYDLRCATGHVFEGWFGSSGDYDDQRGRGLLSCPMCGDDAVDKAPMAPAVPRKAGDTRLPVPQVSNAPDAATMKQMLGALAEMQRKVVAASEPVGDRFPDEARAIHHQEAPDRPIYGDCTPKEAAALKEEGIKVAPLPFPVIRPEDAN